MSAIFQLLVQFQVKHFLIDYPLQTPYMLQKGKLHGWTGPLAAHASEHGMGTFWIALIHLRTWHVPGYFSYALALGLFDFVAHFAIDRIKASPLMLGRFQPNNPYFWWSLGFDQMAHHLNGYAMIYILVVALGAA